MRAPRPAAVSTFALILLASLWPSTAAEAQQRPAALDRLAEEIRRDLASSSHRSGAGGLSAADFEATEGIASIAIVAGNNQALVPNIVSNPMVVRVTGTDGGPPSTPVAVRWSAISPPNGIVPIEGLGDVEAVQYSEGVQEDGSWTVAITTTNSEGLASNRVTSLLPIPIVLRAEVLDSPNLAVAFQHTTGLENISLGPNLVSVAGAIDVVCPSLVNDLNNGDLTAAKGDLLGRCSDMVFGTSDEGAVINALSEVTTEETSAMGSNAVEVNESQFRNVRTRLSALRAGVRGISIQGLTLAYGGDVLPTWALSNILTQSASDDVPSGNKVGRLGYFLNGTISIGSKDDTELEPGFDLDRYALTTGIDWRFSSSFVGGVALGYDEAETKINGGSTLDADALTGMLYGTYYNGIGERNTFYLDAAASLGGGSVESKRRINYSISDFLDPTQINTVNQIALGRPDHDGYSLDLTLGYEIFSGSHSFNFTGRGGIAEIDIDAYAEEMSDPNGLGFGLGLSVDKQEIESNIGALGVGWSYASSKNWGVLIPQLRVEWEHEFANDARLIGARFLNEGTVVEGSDDSKFFVLTNEPDRDYYNIDLGVSAVFSGGSQFFFLYEGVFGRTDIELHSFTAGFRWAF